METLLFPVQKLDAVKKARTALKENQVPIHVTGCMESFQIHLIFALSQEFPWKVIIAQNESAARDLLQEYRLFDREVLYFPAKDVIFYSADIHGNAVTAERLKVMEALLTKQAGTIVTTMDAGLEKLRDIAIYRRAMFPIRKKQNLDLGKVSETLVDIGYVRNAKVEAPGDFSIRGGILDLFPITADCPYRIELWGDEVDTIRSFDVESQRSIEQTECLTVFPASEFIATKKEIETALNRMEKDRKQQEKKLSETKNFAAKNRLNETLSRIREDFVTYGDRAELEAYLPYFSKSAGSLLDFFDRERTAFFVQEPQVGIEKLRAVREEFAQSMVGRLEQGYILPAQAEALFDVETVLAILENKKTVYLTALDTLPQELSAKVTGHLSLSPVTDYNRHAELLAQDINHWKKEGVSVLILAPSRTRAQRLSESLEKDYGIEAFYREVPDIALKPKQVMTSYGFLRRGYVCRKAKFVLITEGDIFGQKSWARRKKKGKVSAPSIQSFNELSVGDYVVHEEHGLGIYRGLEKMVTDGVSKDYIKVEYGDGGNLYVPVANLDVLQKYAGKEAKQPKLNRLNSAEWSRTKTRVKSAVHDVAKELIVLYAQRQEEKGFAFSADTVWQREFEELFPYEETTDQARAIADTKKDMESDKIMDRLICGDVGYGKTEIAIRAAFKAVGDGKQVAFLVPTTILAQQHYNTFTQRLADFPIRVEMLCRFCTAAEQKKTVEQLKKGQVDIVIGTHRLLSNDVAFKDLGLLVVDEEQRFGVTHKEKIKKLKSNVDVLTLSATPIPRTLHMSLAGIRDMSVLTEPPMDRLPIQTFVMEHADPIIREAIARELSRGGQVYYVYNRVDQIDRIAAKVADLLPEARVAYAHGKMGERKLEDIMMSFIAGEIDVLVATTIIETGIDIPNVNTIIIDNADQMGLSQLYQLRGRVGRASRTSFAFFMYRRDKLLREVAQKRLAAIREYTDLGSGIKVAMRDLELRGAGNLLGAEQSGHMAAVGYDLYCKMLNDAVRELKGKEVKEEFETTIDLKLDAYLPAAYIPSEFQKLDLYKKIAGIENAEEYADMQEELADRYGKIPPEAQNLLQIARVKADAHRAGIAQVTQKAEGLCLFLHESAKQEMDSQKMMRMIQDAKGKIAYRTRGKEPYFFCPIQEEPLAPGAFPPSYAFGSAPAEKKGAREEKNVQALFATVDFAIRCIGECHEKICKES